MNPKKRKTQKFGGHSQAQVLDAIKGYHGFVSQIATTLKKAVQVARQKNLQCIQDATVGGAVLSETEYYDKSGNVTAKKTVYPAPSWQAAAWFLERTSFDEFGLKSKLEHTGTDGKDITIKVVYDDK